MQQNSTFIYELVNIPSSGVIKSESKLVEAQDWLFLYLTNPGGLFSTTVRSNLKQQQQNILNLQKWENEAKTVPLLRNSTGWSNKHPTTNTVTNTVTNTNKHRNSSPKQSMRWKDSSEIVLLLALILIRGTCT